MIIAHGNNKLPCTLTPQQAMPRLVNKFPKQAIETVKLTYLEACGKDPPESSLVGGQKRSESLIDRINDLDMTLQQRTGGPKSGTKFSPKFSINDSPMLSTKNQISFTGLLQDKIK